MRTSSYIIPFPAGCRTCGSSATANWKAGSRANNSARTISIAGWRRACNNLGIKGVDLYGGIRHSTTTALSAVFGRQRLQDDGTYHKSPTRHLIDTARVRGRPRWIFMRRRQSFGAVAKWYRCPNQILNKALLSPYYANLYLIMLSLWYSPIPNLSVLRWYLFSGK